MEEIVSLDYIALEHPDAVVNVVDVPALERNLFFTIQLAEHAIPMLVTMNQVDLAEKWNRRGYGGTIRIAGSTRLFYGGHPGKGNRP